MDKVYKDSQTHYIIAIDGPAASGKSTTARFLAEEMKYVYIDTGAMYRACGLLSKQLGISLNDIPAIGKMLETIEIEIVYSVNGNRIMLNRIDVTEAIREKDISRLASDISQIGIVRDKMVDLQRAMGKDGGVVMDGRDIGTVVFPQADFKFFMIADVDTRAERRVAELKAKGIEADFEEVKKDLIWRDKNDSTRALAPLRKADDAIEIDTTGLTIEEQVNKIREIIKNKSYA
ncbi:MAG: (d)CMP kinase [Candidatus Cloacimonetes bacterium]|nr:(d)CMP kinase [Candidatus Cloacimonadota bacterium]